MYNKNLKQRSKKGSSNEYAECSMQDVWS